MAGGCLGSDSEKDEPVPLTVDASSLRAGEQYCGRLDAFNDGGTNTAKLLFETKLVNEPITTIDSVTGVGTTIATFTGTVDPNAPQEASKMNQEEKDAYRTLFHFESTPGCNVFVCEPAPCEGYYGELTAENSDVVTPMSFTAKANHMEANRVFHVRLIAQNPAAPTSPVK